MDKIYLVMVDNGEAYEDYSEFIVGFAETEEEANALVKKFEAERDADAKTFKEFEKTCDECDCRVCNSCGLYYRKKELRDKDIYAGCWDVSDADYFIKDVEKLEV